jgi:predicted AAA+ superfamily ATPase
LRRAGAVVIEGPKACGKTTTGLRQAGSDVRLDLRRDLRLAARLDPSSVLQGPVPRLIDEWQLAPDIWNAVRAEVDARNADGQFILTGSASPQDDATRHSGALRFAYVAMSPMTLAESKLSDSSVSLSDLWEGGKAHGGPVLSDPEVIPQALCRGGWPSNQRRPLADALAANQDYLRTISSADIVTLDGVKHDPLKVSALLYAYSRNTASYVSARTLERDTAAYGEGSSARTISVYSDSLARLWTIVPQRAWGGHLRSSVPVRKASKWHLCDPSLAAAALGATPESLRQDLAAYGQLFETLVFRDLSVYGQAGGFAIRAFSEGSDEIDAVVVKGIDWAGVEVKLSADPAVLDPAAAKLIRIAARMAQPPRFLALITSSGPSYTRTDGVHVASVRHLGA